MKDEKERVDAQGHEGLSERQPAAASAPDGSVQAAVLDDMTEMILNVVEPPSRRADVVSVYATVILFGHFAVPPRMNADWSRVNNAIIGRWSVSALNYIKTRAWKDAERRARELRDKASVDGRAVHTVDKGTAIGSAPDRPSSSLVPPQGTR
jgi:hypothetical protein